MKSLPQHFATLVALGFGLVLTACPSDDGGDDMADDMTDTMSDTTDTTDTMDTTDTGGALSHAADIQPLWDASCVTGCHTPGGVAAFLDLTDGYATMVGVASTQATGNLVEAGSSTDSYLVAKLRGTQAEFGGTGAQMPSGSDPLSQDDIALVVSWIDSGANP